MKKTTKPTNETLISCNNNKIAEKKQTKNPHCFACNNHIIKLKQSSNLTETKKSQFPLLSPTKRQFLNNKFLTYHQQFHK